MVPISRKNPVEYDNWKGLYSMREEVEVFGKAFSKLTFTQTLLWVKTRMRLHAAVVVASNYEKSLQLKIKGIFL